jgi:DNA-binding transcriptional LysR family regulator
VAGTIPFVRRHVIPKLPAFYAAHPDIEIDLLLDDGNIGLVDEGIEVALRMGNLQSSGLTARKIGQARRLVVGATSYFREHEAPREPRDLTRHRALVFSRGEGGERHTFEKDGRTLEVTLRSRLRVSALEGLRAGILSGLGIAVATEWLFGPELGDGRLQVVLADWHLPPIELWAVFPGGRRASAKARAFAAFVETQLASTSFAVSARGRAPRAG